MNVVCKSTKCSEAGIVKHGIDEPDAFITCGECHEPVEMTSEEVSSANPAN